MVCEAISEQATIDMSISRYGGMCRHVRKNDTVCYEMGPLGVEVECSLRSADIRRSFGVQQKDSQQSTSFKTNELVVIK